MTAVNALMATSVNLLHPPVNALLLDAATRNTPKFSSKTCPFFARETRIPRIHPHMKLPRPLVRVLKWGLLAGGAGALAVLAVNAWMLSRARGKITSVAAEVPANEVGIVLGTSPRL